MKRLKGIVPVLVSPIDEEGNVDEESYHRLLDFTMKHPIGGHWVLGSASEDFLISQKDRVRITRIISEHVDGKLPVIVSCSEPAFDDVCRFFDKTGDMNFSAYHLLPTDRKMKPSLIIRYVTMVADKAPKPLWLYNNELRALKIPVPVVQELKDHSNIVGIKAAGYDLKDIIPFCMMDSPEFQTIGSGGGHLLLFLAMGCDAHTVSPACCFPAEYCRIFDLWQQGNLDEARAISFKLSRVIKALPHPENTEFSAEEKAVLEVLGICKRHMYPPFFECTDQEIEATSTVLRNASML